MGNRLGTGGHGVTEGMSCGPGRRVLPERSRIQYGYRETYSSTRSATGIWKLVSGKYSCCGRLRLAKVGTQTERVTELKCLQLAPNGAGAARKGAGGRSPRIENRSSAERVSDGILKPNPEDSLHYRLLLSDGDINNRGEGVEEFNKLVCRPYYSVVRGQRQSG